MTEFTLSVFMRDVNTVFIHALDMVDNIHDKVVQCPLLLVPVIIGLSGIAIGFFNRLKQ